MRGSQSVELLEGVGGIGVLNSHPDPLVTPKFHQCRQFQVKQSNHPDLTPKLTSSHIFPPMKYSWDMCCGVALLAL